MWLWVKTRPETVRVKEGRAGSASEKEAAGIMGPNRASIELIGLLAGSLAMRELYEVILVADIDRFTGGGVDWW